MSTPDVTPKKSVPDWRARVRAELGNRDWSDLDLGRKMGLKHPNHVSRWLRDKKPVDPKWTIILKMAEALEVSPDWMAGLLPGPGEDWTDADLAGALRSLAPAHRKVLRVLFAPGGASHLEHAADSYLELRRSLGRAEPAPRRDS